MYRLDLGEGLYIRYTYMRVYKKSICSTQSVLLEIYKVDRGEPVVYLLELANRFSFNIWQGGFKSSPLNIPSFTFPGQLCLIKKITLSYSSYRQS